MDNHIIGFIGYGEAAYLISQGLKKEGIDRQYAFDVNINDPVIGSTIRNRIDQLELNLTHTLEELCNQCTIIFCATNATVAEKIAKEIKPYLSKKHLYIDINSCSPMMMETIAKHITETDALFVDAAVMESVPLRKHKVPMFISGDGAKTFLKFGSKYGLNLTLINENPGSSSAIKMLRSVFVKGFTALLTETLQASDKLGLSETVLESLNQFISQGTLEEAANRLISRTAIHAERRVAEMDEVIKTLENLNVDTSLSEAVKSKLEIIVESEVRKKLNNEVPKYYKDVFQALSSEIRVNK